MPQFPVLYGGISLRDNLDPFHHREDEEIYQALVHVSMVDAVESLPCGLDTIMSEGGSCFSAGQKQLLCLVRAVLRKNLEYGSPRELIANRGTFSMMLDETAGMASMPKARAETHDVVTATDL